MDNFNPTQYTEQLEKAADWLKENRHDLPDVIATYRKSAEVIKGLVRQGRWIEWWPPKAMILTGEEMLYCCSCCEAKYADIEGFSYCPYCGAKMDLEG